MDKATRIKVANELNKHFSKINFFTEERVKKFKKVNKLSSGFCEYQEVYVVQRGSSTILVRIKPNGNICVKKLAW